MNANAAIINAPWTPDQVDTLNRWQASAVVHPYTCGDDECRRLHRDPLVASVEGWYCRHCSYRQTWAAHMLVDGVLLDRLLLVRRRFFWRRAPRRVSQMDEPWGWCKHCGDGTEKDDDPAPDLCLMCAKAGRGAGHAEAGG